MRKIIMLDIDGVLNIVSSMMLGLDPEDHHNYFDEGCVKNLHEIIEKTNADIVISSTWRKTDWDKLIKIFEKRGFKYCNKIIGRTGSYYTCKIKELIENENKREYIYEYIQSCPRGVEIDYWLTENIKDEEYSFCIIDDDSDFLIHQINNFVKTNAEVGIDNIAKEQIIKILNTPIKNPYYTKND